jgi:ATP-dependent helicase/nuclease subunit A
MSAILSKKPTPTPEQRRAADPASSVWVAANAGSGKTHVLVDRVVRLLLAGANPQAILCLTFTKAAAAEMSTRLFKRLGEWVAMTDADLDDELLRLGERDIDHAKRAEARKLFARALETPGGLRIQTIHAFCERLLQLFPVESGLAPGFRIMDDTERQRLEEVAFRAALMDDSEGIKQGWSFLESGDVASLPALVKSAREFLGDRAGLRQKLADPDFLVTLESKLSDVLDGVDPRSVEAIDQEILAVDQAQYARVAASLLPFGKYGKLDTPALVIAISIGTPSLEKLSALFIKKSEPEPHKKLFGVDFAKQRLVEANWLEIEKERVVKLLHKRALREILDATILVTTAFAGVQSRIIQEKRQRGLYDFDDLIARASQLLSKAESAQWVLNKLDAGLSHILVDEAQDTSPAQWQIIKSLAEEFFAGAGRPRPETRTIFAVGDAKQSIFSFQGADTSAFTDAQGFFQRKVGERFDDVGLAISYRSTPEILRVVDKVFAPGTAARVGYGSNADSERVHTAERKNAQGVFELWPLIEAPDEEPEDHWQAPVDRESDASPHLKVARLIATQVKSWIGRREIVAAGKIVAPDDILILVQRRGGILFQALIAELRKRDVPVSGADVLILQESLIIQDLLALGQFLRLPQDDHALACVLKSPLMPKPATEDELLYLANGRGNQSLWQRLNGDATQIVNANHLAFLATLAGEVGPFDFFSRATHVSARAIRERLGREAEDAVAEFLNLAMDHELTEDVSIASFLDQFQRGESIVKREMEQASGEVRIMTVHGAKGLEAPIVILADAAYFRAEKTENGIVPLPDFVGELKGFPMFVPNTIVKPEIVNQWKQAKADLALAERYRLLYVAMTRARDELHVFGSTGKRGDREKNWYVTIAEAFQNPDAQCETQMITSDFGAILRHGAEPKWTDVAPESNSLETSLPSWTTTAVAPSMPLKPKYLASREDQSGDAEAARRGVAIHRILELLGDAPDGERQALARRQARRLGLNEEDITGLLGFLASPEAREFFAQGSSPEVELRGTLPNGEKMSARVDRLAEHDNAFWLLDYKTGPRQRLAHDHAYVKQMAKYAWLLRQAKPGQEVRTALLWTQSGALEWLSTELLSQAIDHVPQSTS